MIGIILASIAALSLIAVGVFAVIRQRTAANAVLLAAALLLAGGEVFDQLSLLPSLDTALFRRISLHLESLLPLSFLYLSLMYGRQRPYDGRSKRLLGLAAAAALFPAIALIIGADNFSYSPDFESERVLFLGSEGYWYYLGMMVTFIIALVNVEATLRATHGMARNRMKFEAFGIMGLLAVLVFYYSQGLLYRTINMDLVPMRSGVIIASSLLIGYAQAFRGNWERVSVSRHVLYRSVTLLVVGCYLVGLGLIGQGMRYFGEPFGRNVTIFFAFAGGIFLLAVLFSDRARRRAKVWISKHFYANKHDYREEWLKFTSRISSCATLPDVLGSILTAYQETFGLGGASVYLPGKDEKRFVRASGLNMPDGPVELSISLGLRDYFVKRERVLDLTDGEYQLSAAERAAFTEARAWLVVPLISSEKIEGLAVLGGRIIPETLIYDDFDLMKVMARQAGRAVANLRLLEEVMEMRAMAAVSQISAFVIHDLKNLTTGLSLVVDNAGEHIGNPEFQQDAIMTIKNTLAKMKGLIQRLKTIPEKLALNTKVEDLGRLVRETVAEFSRMRPGRRIGYSAGNGAHALSRVDGDELKKVIVNLVQNAVEASGEQGPVMVETCAEAGGVRISVTDTGCGMTGDFMKNHLFKPFRTTKEAGLGIGLYQCRQIIEAHGGAIEVKSEAGRGTTFTVLLPSAGERECVSR